MSSPVFGRVLTAMVTPMTADGALDETSIVAVAEHLVAHGHDGIVVNGTTGESPTLSADESIRAVRLVVEAVGDRVTVEMCIRDRAATMPPIECPISTTSSSGC